MYTKMSSKQASRKSLLSCGQAVRYKAGQKDLKKKKQKKKTTTTMFVHMNCVRSSSLVTAWSGSHGLRFVSILGKENQLNVVENVSGEVQTQPNNPMHGSIPNNNNNNKEISSSLGHAHFGFESKYRYTCKDLVY